MAAALRRLFHGPEVERVRPEPEPPPPPPPPTRLPPCGARRSAAGAASIVASGRKPPGRSPR
ncbi:hypothetical protein JRQ81_011030 [Phrynocephalus forsythii]|uniref:Uncharacterized protein n=1 Tax=Phrynocephalus forsythii TaxID=171643 RepID=A0A9Q0X7Y0_9SAUR|nr:hypothetical protein JRQ81_011030 [Phrynocephalus forsythii]